MGHSLVTHSLQFPALYALKPGLKRKKYHNVGKCSQAGVKMKWVTPGKDFLSFFSCISDFKALPLTLSELNNSEESQMNLSIHFCKHFLSIDSDSRS